jgi:hypothetical protein
MYCGAGGSTIDLGIVLQDGKWRVQVHVGSLNFSTVWKMWEIQRHITLWALSLVTGKALLVSGIC